MNKNILNIEIQDFIDSNLNSKTSDILFKGTPFNCVTSKEIVAQVEAKIKCEKKLPTWFGAKNIYYPNKLNIEQTSSEVTAAYKSSLVDGQTIIDLTGGFGVDSFYFSKRFKSVVHCEIDPSLSQIAQHNFKQLQIDNIETINADGLDYLKIEKIIFDWIYVDPSRRHDSKGKVFFLKDCLPNVPEQIGTLFKYSKNILVKTSPLLDLSVGIGELKHVKAIHVVALNNEVKELLWLLEDGFSAPISVKTVNIKSNAEEHFSFEMEDEKEASPIYGHPSVYLFEPNAAILKAGGFNSISKALDLIKLHKHSHLYTNDSLINFPGRVFKIENIIPYNKKELKRFGIAKANITTRNFPECVQQIRSKFKIKEGGDDYLFFTTNKNDEKIVLACTKISEL